MTTQPTKPTPPPNIRELSASTRFKAWLRAMRGLVGALAKLGDTARHAQQQFARIDEVLARFSPCWLCGVMYYYDREAAKADDAAHRKANRLTVWARHKHIDRAEDIKRADWSKAEGVPVCGTCTPRAKARPDMMPYTRWQRVCAEAKADEVTP